VRRNFGGLPKLTDNNSAMSEYLRVGIERERRRGGESDKGVLLLPSDGHGGRVVVRGANWHRRPRPKDFPQAVAGADRDRADDRRASNLRGRRESGGG
jgi:hypothetical protein